MKFSDIFRSSPATEPVSAPAESNQEESTEPKVSPLEAFKDIWQSDTTEAEQDDADLSSLFSIDPEKINSTVSNIDFTKSLDPQVLESIAAGGEDAQKAFLTSLNSVARDVFSQSMLANGMLVKQALTKAQDKIDTRTSRSYNRLKASEALTSSNPLLKDPAVEPMISAIQERLHKKYPDADSESIKQQAEEYLLKFADVIRGPSEQRKQEETSAKETDFSTFLDF
ncbi:hypothetical protein [Candidatus Macondimonas diazotrophica]|jgi:hypothetical protein|uniref:Uncharacterized protein n=1 Tax=Candidatus Macondimonas diazotrophica TaxID=2305248 RepID=A0A4Z0F7N2_9GAMM|nr:hypothetical protein [Candidatus Macondimonas diazotrophica]TFZ81695.1 hypothetical protein E4680_11535 [Candidatus Macondimonas diazotrophica]